MQDARQARRAADFSQHHNLEGEINLAEDTPGAKSDITIVKDDTGLATGKAGVQPNSPSQGAADENSAAMPDPNDRNGNDRNGAGAQGGADDQGATGKSTEDLGAPPAEPPQKEGQLPSPSSSY